jgi:hypothetical protein
MSKQFYIAIATTQPIPKIEVTAPENAATPTSIWGLAAAIIIASIPHLWQWLGGHQQARNSLTERLLQNLNDSYKLYAISNDGIRTMLSEVAEKPTEIAEANNLALRDVMGELVDIRKEQQKLHRKLDDLGTIVTRQAQNR